MLHEPRLDDGAEGIRTPDLLLAKEALSQLSYGPVKIRNQCVRILNRAVSNWNLNEWAFLGSNQRPQSYQDCALTS